MGHVNIAYVSRNTSVEILRLDTVGIAAFKMIVYNMENYTT